MTSSSLPPGASERFVQTNGLRLHVVEAGPQSGPPVVLLHGFPELWYGWRKQLGPLAEAGFRVIVPDQRGYNTSDKPRGVAAYRIETLAEDVVGLLAAAGLQRAAVGRGPSPRPATSRSLREARRRPPSPSRAACRLRCPGP